MSTPEQWTNVLTDMCWEMQGMWCMGMWGNA